MAYSIPFSFIAILRALLQVFVWLTIGGLLVVWGTKNPDKSWAIWVGGFFFFISYFLPAFTAQDLNYRIPELKSAEGELKKKGLA